MARSSFFAALVCFSLCVVGRLAAQRRPCHDLGPAETLMRGIVQKRLLAGASLALEKLDGASYVRHFGSYHDSTVVPIASASKLVSACVLLRLVDEKKLDLDDPVGKYLASFTGTKATITLRQCFSHTSGLPGNSLYVGARSLTLARAVDLIGANVALQAQPGAQFDYGGVSMHVAGRVCEIVSGMGFEQLVQDRLCKPLGITTLDYQGLGATTNYRVAGGVQCRLEDYRRILHMLMNGGVYGTTRVLSTEAVQTMISDQTRGAKIVSTPQPDERRYGIGVWLDRVEGRRTLQVSSQGAFGFSPWIDFERELAGIVLVDDRLQSVYDDVTALQVWSRGEFALRGAACFGEETPLGVPRLRLLPLLEAVAGTKDFALRASGAPAAAPGLGLLGSPHTGLDLLGLRLHVGPTPPPIVLLLVANAQGAADIPMPIPASARGARLAMQALWVEDSRAGTSPALQLHVR